jgi:Tol biopolymer transport system component/tRNA A-37 threonylcarbamoyl transferase component Bud32
MTVERLSASLADRYLIERELGQGGMATVYLAQDVRHDRKVALKVLRPELAAIIGAERFLSEIKTTANLQHPHILPLFDSGEADGFLFYVMPFVEGETVRDRISREKQLPVDDAVRIAKEVASALDYAHRRNIIHRDIKPENILLHDGAALVADFGIALAVSRSDGGSRMTETGMSLGTPHYMSPEQAMGQREITARSDVYALGCVLYEMLTGEPPFNGPTPQAIVARVMTEEPRSLTLQRKSIPLHVEAAVTTALEKLPADRFPSATAFAAALDNASFTRAASPAGAAAQAAAGAPRARTTLRLVLATAAAVALVTFGLTRWLVSPGAATAARSAHVSIALPDGYEIGAPNLRPLAISHDGARVAFVGLKDGKNRIFVRALEESEATALEGTEGGDGPFFSPDGEWIGFFAGGKLRKITVSGAALQTLADAPFHRGGDWGDDGFLYFAPTNVGSIWRVPEAGGAATEVTRVNPSAGEISHRWPHRVAGTNALLFSVWTGPGDDEHLVATLTMGSREHRPLIKGGDAPAYVAKPGFLLYTHRGQLFTVPWRPSQPDLGKAVPVAAAEQLNDRIGNEGCGNYSVSDDGTLAYLGGGRFSGDHRLVWVDRTGALTPLPLPERIYENAAISPDGDRAVVQIREATTALWIYDFGRGTLTPLNTGAGSSQAPLWTADGRRVIYRGTRQGTRNLYWIPVDGSGGEERLTSKPGVVQTPTSISADGRVLLFDETGLEEPEGAGIWILRLDGDRSTHRLFPLPTAGRDGQLSPDGRWVAYQATVSSRQEIFVSPFSSSGERRLVSTDGGTEPLWSRDGRQLFFQSGTRLMGVTVTPGATFSASPPRLVHEGRFVVSINGNTSFSATKDGARFLRIQPVAEEPAITRVELVLDWFAALNRRARGHAQ